MRNCSGRTRQQPPSGQPDLALIDIVMPKREGLETIAELRRTSVMPIVAMSGGGMTRSSTFLDCAAEMGRQPHAIEAGAQRGPASGHRHVSRGRRS